MTSIFLSYARGDDVDPFDPATSFVARLHRDLTARGFEVWFDRIAMPSRGLTFHQEIQYAVMLASFLKDDWYLLMGSFHRDFGPRPPAAFRAPPCPAA